MSRRPSGVSVSFGARGGYGTCAGHPTELALVCVFIRFILIKSKTMDDLSRQAQDTISCLSSFVYLSRTCLGKSPHRRPDEHHPVAKVAVDSVARNQLYFRR
jgi:hypothetical protein